MADAPSGTDTDTRPASERAAATWGTTDPVVVKGDDGAASAAATTLPGSPTTSDPAATPDPTAGLPRPRPDMGSTSTTSDPGAYPSYGRGTTTPLPPRPPVPGAPDPSATSPIGTTGPTPSGSAPDPAATSSGPATPTAPPWGPHVGPRSDTKDVLDRYSDELNAIEGILNPAGGPVNDELWGKFQDRHRIFKDAMAKLLGHDDKTGLESALKAIKTEQDSQLLHHYISSPFVDKDSGAVLEAVSALRSLSDLKAEYPELSGVPMPGDGNVADQLHDGIVRDFARHGWTIPGNSDPLSGDDAALAARLRAEGTEGQKLLANALAANLGSMARSGMVDGAANASDLSSWLFPEDKAKPEPEEKKAEPAATDPATTERLDALEKDAAAAREAAQTGAEYNPYGASDPYYQNGMGMGQPRQGSIETVEAIIQKVAPWIAEAFKVNQQMGEGNSEALGGDLAAAIFAFKVDLGDGGGGMRRAA